MTRGSNREELGVFTLVFKKISRVSSKQIASSQVYRVLTCIVRWFENRGIGFF